MDYKYNIQTNEYPEIYMPGYGELKDSSPLQNELLPPTQMQTNQPSSNQQQPTSPSVITSPSPDVNDTAYILFLYPKEAQEINKIVNNKLNTLDYDGSIIFHEYPDKEAIKNIIEQIKVPFSIEEISPNWLKQLIEVIFLNEMNNRRKERNNNSNNSNNNLSQTPASSYSQE